MVLVGAEKKADITLRTLISGGARVAGVSGAIARLSQVLERIGENEFGRTAGRLGGLTDEQRCEVGLMARRIVGKVLHSAARALREEARTGNGAQMERSIRRIFGT